MNPEPHIVTSVSNPAIKEIHGLRMRKERKRTGLFLAEGERLLREAQELGYAPEILIYDQAARDDHFVRALTAEAFANKARVIETSAKVLEKIASKDNPQQVIGVFRQIARSFSEIDPAAAPLWAAAEEIRDPGNLGTLIRTADAVKAGGIILIGTTCDPFSVEAVRATMGSLFAVPIYAGTREEAVELFARWPGIVVGSALQTSLDYREVRYTAPALILAGSERYGLSDEIRTACHQLVRLPMLGRADSLNLSVAASILLYAALADQQADAS